MSKSEPVNKMDKHFEEKPKTKKSKKENAMKKTIITSVVTIILTLALVASYAYTYQKGKSDQRTHDSLVSSQAKELATQLTSKN